jgi:hypothetical protein
MWVSKIFRNEKMMKIKMKFLIKIQLAISVPLIRQNTLTVMQLGTSNTNTICPLTYRSSIRNTKIGQHRNQEV